ncbi:secoisolariciresinol dehydrogenase-like [Apium graveolens]|uniref:secoisolariciresinol dehydrogenase-like n=1 Tax=Apium graveolens TaxID=4045 RepID=UPI003D7BEB28
MDKRIATYGKFDIMFKNASTFDPSKPQFFDNIKSDLEHFFAINVPGAFLGMKHAARVMVPAGAYAMVVLVQPHMLTLPQRMLLGLTKNQAIELRQCGILSQFSFVIINIYNLLEFHPTQFISVKMASTDLLATATTRRLEGKVALITGGASGIGEHSARIFVQHGAKVVIADIQDELGHIVVEALGKSNSIYVHCDVSNEDHVKDAVDKAISTYGKLDIMYNNAGIIDPGKPRILDNLKSDFERVFAVNVIGGFLGMKHAARVMVPAKSGCIISTCSLCSERAGQASHAYTASKHAILGLTKNMAVELGQFGIRVNCLSPSGVATPFGKNTLGVEKDEEFEAFLNSFANLKGVTLRTEDVANAALYLASDEAKYISGQNLFIDGALGNVCSPLKMV